MRVVGILRCHCVSKTGGRFFAEFHSELVKGVDPPDKGLVHGFGLIKREQRTDASGRKVFDDNRCGRAVSGKRPGRVIGIFAGSQGVRLGDKVGPQFLMVGYPF